MVGDRAGEVYGEGGSGDVACGSHSPSLRLSSLLSSFSSVCCRDHPLPPHHMGKDTGHNCGGRVTGQLSKVSRGVGHYVASVPCGEGPPVWFPSPQLSSLTLSCPLSQ